MCPLLAACSEKWWYFTLSEHSDNVSFTIYQKLSCQMHEMLATCELPAKCIYFSVEFTREYFYQWEIRIYISSEAKPIDSLLLKYHGSSICLHVLCTKCHFNSRNLGETMSRAKWTFSCGIPRNLQSLIVGFMKELYQTWLGLNSVG